MDGGSAVDSAGGEVVGGGEVEGLGAVGVEDVVEGAVGVEGGEGRGEGGVERVVDYLGGLVYGGRGEVMKGERMWRGRERVEIASDLPV